MQTVTLTAKVKIKPSAEQVVFLSQTLQAYCHGCNLISQTLFAKPTLHPADLHRLWYRPLRERFGLRSQMAQSVLKTVLAKYKSAKSNNHPFTHIRFRKPELDLVWNRDYSLKPGLFSLNTLQGRIQVPFEAKGMEHFFDGVWNFGTAKVLQRGQKWFLHIPMTKHVEAVTHESIHQVVGIDMGINFIATAYDSAGKTTFFSGKRIKQKRAAYKRMRQALQKRQTPSSRRKLKKIGQRENRFVTDVNHQVSKALVNRYGAGTFFVMENLQGIRKASEKVKLRNRYLHVSWSYYQLRMMLEYKAKSVGSATLAVDPRYTSQRCPKCGHTAKANRDSRRHRFCCVQCGYRSNDDRIGAINVWDLGIQWLHPNVQVACLPA